MLHNLKAFGRILFGTPFWFISCTALGIWLVDPSGPLRRDEVPQVRWSKPSGNAPVWLSARQAADARADALRAKLETRVSVCSEDASLEQILDEIAEQIGVSFVIKPEASHRVHEYSIVRLSFDQMCVADILEQMLTPLDFTWQLGESQVEILDIFDAIETLRCYDLAWVLRGDQQADNVARTIDDFILNGNTCSRVGSGLFVQGTELDHHRVERILAQLPRLPDSNLRRLSTNSFVPSNGTTPSNMSHCGVGGFF